LLLAGALGRLICHFHGRRKKVSFLKKSSYEERGGGD
jgi:hypothetical protein